MGRARLTITQASASPSLPIQQTKLQKWLKGAEIDDTRADLFVHLNRADNWFDLYKSAELTRRLAGGANKLGLVLGSDKKEWDRIWRTANCYRHAPDPKSRCRPDLPNSMARGSSCLRSSRNFSEVYSPRGKRKLTKLGEVHELMCER